MSTPAYVYQPPSAPTPSIMVPELEALAASLSLNPQDHPALVLALDQADPLAAMREEYHIPSRGDIRAELALGPLPDDALPCAYFTGNSLGLQPRRVPLLVQAELSKWARQGVRGHFTGERPWVRIDAPLAPLLAEMVGAQESEV